MNLVRNKHVLWSVSPANAKDLTDIARELREAADGLEKFMFGHFDKYGGPEKFLSMFGDGTPWGFATKAAIAWFRQFGTDESLAAMAKKDETQQR